MRSLEEPPGFMYSIFTAMVAFTPSSVGMWPSLTSGVFPMSSAVLFAMVMIVSFLVVPVSGSGGWVV